MLFVAPQFLLVFLPLTLLLYWGLERWRGREWALGGLLFGSFVFYLMSGWVGLVLLLTSLVVNFSMGHWLARTNNRGALSLAVGLNLSLLALFKYADFVLATLEEFSSHPLPRLHWQLPLGISFFTFQQIAYLVQCWRSRRSEITWRDYTLAVIFFPHLIAGPLVHYRDLIGQFRSPERSRVAKTCFHEAVNLFVVALGKKLLIADSLSPIAAEVFAKAAHGEEPGMAEAWLGALAYTFQIYFDFSAYSEMAIGLGLMFGVRLPLNFLRPYMAVDIRDFWRRWHMTLSEFLRDYLYIPLGGNRRGPARRWLNLFITMTLGGLWHGAGWTFLAWGALHGLSLGINHAWSSVSPVHLPRWLARLLTFLVVVFLWVPFRAESWSATTQVWHAMTSFSFHSEISAASSSLSTTMQSIATYRASHWDGSLWQRLSLPAVQTWLPVVFAAALAFLTPSNNSQAESPRSRTPLRALWLGFLLFAITARSFQAPPGEFLYFRF